jgi:hypothetical protein
LPIAEASHHSDLFCVGTSDARVELQIGDHVVALIDLAVADGRQEVEQGLHEIEDDIKTKKITKIINDYKNDYGDYLFIITEKQSLL